jgi:hypothetical protein
MSSSSTSIPYVHSWDPRKHAWVIHIAGNAPQMLPSHFGLTSQMDNMDRRFFEFCTWKFSDFIKTFHILSFPSLSFIQAALLVWLRVLTVGGHRYFELVSRPECFGQDKPVAARFCFHGGKQRRTTRDTESRWHIRIRLSAVGRHKQASQSSPFPG